MQCVLFSTGHNEGMTTYKSEKLVITQRTGQGMSSASVPAHSLSTDLFDYNVGLGTLESAL